MAFTIANMKKTKSILSASQMTPGIKVNGAMFSGGSQPPKNRIEVMAHISSTLMYSPRKNSRNGVAEYSTKKPATSSDSASTRSKGGRFVSARAETKKIGSIGKRMEKTFQPAKAKILPVSCARTMAERFSEPANRRTVMMT